MEMAVAGWEEAMARIREAVEVVRGRTDLVPRVGIIMGTGLRGLVGEIDAQVVLPHEEITHFPLSTMEGHPGRLILGQLDGTPVVALQDRFHRYEGYSLQEVTFPIRVLRKVPRTAIIP